MKRTAILLLLVSALFLHHACAEEDTINTLGISSLYIGQSLSDVISLLNESCVSYEVYSEDDVYTSVFTNLDVFGAFDKWPMGYNSSIIFENECVIEVECDLGVFLDFTDVYDCAYNALGKADYAQIPDCIDVTINDRDIDMDFLIMAAWEHPTGFFVLKLYNSISGYFKTSVFESTVDIDERMLQSMEFCVMKKDDFFDYYVIEE